MNIFVLGEMADPVLSAQYQCDKHVCKMVCEQNQLLSGVWDDGPYKRTHYNHPCAVWCRKSPVNYAWALEHGRALLDEYTFRYGKVHACERVWDWCNKRFKTYTVSPFLTHSNGITPFAMAMPEQYKCDNPVAAYRNYYLHDKAGIAEWNRGRNAPHWWVFDSQTTA